MDKKMAENAFFNIIYKLLNVLFPLITSAYVSRVLLSDGVGRVEYARNFATIFVFVAALGIPAYGTKVIARSGNSNESNDKNFSELLIMLVVSSFVCFCVYVSLILTINKFSEEIPLYFATGLQIIMVSMNIDWLYQGKEIYKYITYRSFVVKVCSLICILLFVKTKDDYILYALITSLAVAGNNVFNMIHSRKYVRFTFRGLNIARHILPVGILLLSTIAGELYSKIDVLMLGHFCSDNNIGYYSNAIKVINTVLTAVTAITAVYLPRLSLLAKEDKEKFSQLACEGVKIIAFLTIPSCIGLIMVSKPFVVTMFGSDFLIAYLALRILSPLIIIKGIGDLINYQVIISVGKEKYFLITTGLAAIINIFLNYVLIPLYQQNGAAVASLISELIVNIGMLFVSARIIHMKIDVKFTITIILSALSMAVVVFVVQCFIVHIQLQLILSIILGVVVYMLINIIMRNVLLLQLFEKLKINR